MFHSGVSPGMEMLSFAEKNGDAVLFIFAFIFFIERPDFIFLAEGRCILWMIV